MLSLIDTRLVPSLLTERTSVSPGSLTPIAHGMQNFSQQSGMDRDLLEVMLDFAASTNYECLELLDGSGDTPLHWAVKSQRFHYVECILRRRADLLYRENSVGRTPLEMAKDAYVSSLVRDVPPIPSGRTTSIVHRATHTFAKGHEESGSCSNVQRIWNICSGFVEGIPGKRKLVSLLDANEVANRLAKRQMGRQAMQAIRTDEDEEADEAHLEADEVRDWYCMAKKGNGEYDTEMPDRTASTGKPTHALADFQRQLELLEEQNKKRKAMGAIF